MIKSGPNVINDFRGENEFLSNFYPSILMVDDELYPTLEHAFQAAKTDDLNLKTQIRNAPTAKEAKRLGRSVVLIPDWDQKRLDVMASLVKQKFTEHLDLKIRLLLTGDKELIEGNTWKDRFWGQDQHGVGENNLGKILVTCRTQIRAAEGGAFQVLLKFLQTRKLDQMATQLDQMFKAVEEIESLNKLIASAVASQQLSNDCALASTLTVDVSTLLGSLK